MKLINQLHQEHNSSEKATESTVTMEDPDEVLNYRRTQAILTLQGNKKTDLAQDKSAQIFKGLELKSVGMITRPTGTQHTNKDTDATPSDAAQQESTETHRAKHNRRVRKREAEKPIEIIIPLANDRLKSMSVHNDKTLAIEYAARYLEKLGVSPTPVNLQLISKHIPLDRCKIQQVFHPGLSKHEKKNYIIIKPNQKQPKHASFSSYDPQYIPFQQINDHVLQAAEPEEQEKSTDAGENDEETDQKGIRIRSFDTYKQSYVFPYNLQGRHAAVAKRQNKKTVEEIAKGHARQQTDTKKQTEHTENDPDHPHEEELYGSYESPRDIAPEDAAEELTKQRLELQDSLLHLLKKQMAGTLSPSDEDTLRTTLEKNAAEGDLSHLQFHPDLETEKRGDTPKEKEEKESNVVHPKPPIAPQKRSSVENGAFFNPGFEERRGGGGNVVDPFPPAVLKELVLVPGFSLPQTRNFFHTFVEGFPFKTFWEQRREKNEGEEPQNSRTFRRKTMQERITALSEELQSNFMVEFEHMYVSFVYWSLIAPNVPEAATKREAQNFDERFVEVYQKMLEILLRKRRRSQYAFDLPVTLLGIRVVSEAILTACYPLFCETPQGESMLAEVNCLITHLLDPVGYLTHISTVESSPQALKVMHSKRLPPRMALSFTSPVVRFIVGEAQSREAKALLSSKGGRVADGSGSGDGGASVEAPEAFNLLTPAVSSRLLSVIARHRQELKAVEAMSTAHRSRLSAKRTRQTMI